MSGLLTSHVQTASVDSLATVFCQGWLYIYCFYWLCTVLRPKAASDRAFFYKILSSGICHRTILMETNFQNRQGQNVKKSNKWNILNTARASTFQTTFWSPYKPHRGLPLTLVTLILLPLPNNKFLYDKIWKVPFWKRYIFIYWNIFNFVKTL